MENVIGMIFLYSFSLSFFVYFRFWFEISPCLSGNASPMYFYSLFKFKIPGQVGNERCPCTIGYDLGLVWLNRMVCLLAG